MRLEEAHRAFQAALIEFRAAKADHYINVTNERLQRVVREISQQKNANSEVGERP